MMGASFAVVDESGAVQSMLSAADTQPGYWMITANLDHLRRYRSEPLARELMDGADMVVADGTPLVWASRLARTPLPERVAGSNLIWLICEAAAHAGKSIFLLGGTTGVADRAAQILRERYPKLEVVGTACPPMGFEHDPQELRRLEDQVVEAAPAIVLVALGFPKQDLLIRDLRQALPAASYVGVGISLSFVAGEVTRAPRWTHRVGLEWAYRLWQEPGRLTRRYLIDGLPFALRLMLSALRHRVRPSATRSRWGSYDIADPAGAQAPSGP